MAHIVTPAPRPPPYIVETMADLEGKEIPAVLSIKKTTSTAKGTAAKGKTKKGKTKKGQTKKGETKKKETIPDLKLKDIELKKIYKHRANELVKQDTVSALS